MKRIFAIVAVLGLWSGNAFAQTQVTCSQNAQSLAGDPGAVHNVVCPAGCGSSTAWGTGIYSDDSSVCTAAIHAGVINAAAGGAVTVTIAPGQPAYPSSAANGISTSQWGSWSRSFTVAGAGLPVTCSTNAQGLAGDPGTQHTVICPGGCGTSTAWGTSVYSDDSAVCTAAIHNGTITAAAGGPVVVTIRSGLAAYPPSTHNGITSSQWGEWGRSFTVGRPGGTCDNSCASANDGECDDGGPASQFALCGLGTDCNDCGPR
jgi:hypothetical protein